MHAENKIIGGVHALNTALAAGQLVKLFVASNKQSKKVNQLKSAAKEAGVVVETVEFYQIDMMLPSMRHHNGVAGVCRSMPTDAPTSWQDVIAGKKNPLLLVLDGLQDPHNLGACLRSALAAGVDAVIIPNHNAAQITPTVEKVASGAVGQIPVFAVVNVTREMEKMRALGIWLVGGAGEAEKCLYDVDLTTPLAIVIGNEGEGLRFGVRQACDTLAAIPLNPQMESLNASVACGVMLFEARRQRLAAS